MAAVVKHAPVRATYRLQLHHEFTLRDAARIVPYLANLGISHVYTSPLLKARAGSLHGYDVVDHTLLNPELGTDVDFDEFVAALHRHGLGLIVDIVPNHLGVMGDGNRWWLDLLENGPAAQAAAYFDIDWRPIRPSMRHRLLVAVLGEPYGTVLERGEIVLEFAAARGEFNARYHEHCFPIDPREYPRIFAGAALDTIDDAADRADFESLLNSFAHLPARDALGEDARNERYRDKEAHKRRLVRLVERSPAVLAHVAKAVVQVNGVPGQPDTFDVLDALLEAQAYRLSYWRVAADEINYRRFFDVNNLAALRMDKPDVFDATHALILRWVAEGKIDGLRIDHSDGLYDPEAYFTRLREAVNIARGEDTPFHIVTEKILAAHEALPATWAVQGTTGYEFGALVAAWLVDGASERALSRLYAQFSGETQRFDEIAYQGKKLVMRVALAAEVEVLASQLDRIAQLDRHTADFTRPAIREAVIETIACFPVYRTYISDRAVSDEDRRIVTWAVNVARKRSFAADISIFDFLREVLLGEGAQDKPASHLAARREFAMKFQQVTSPVTAKGVEDTALYRYNRLLCLNEVGGDPRRFGLSSHALHQANAERLRAWPRCMLSTATHDSKRGEDVRARLAVLSEIPELWRRHLSRWSRLNRSKRRMLDAAPAPSRNDEYLVYQTLLGIWSPDADTAQLTQRLQDYLQKALREAKVATSWLNPNPEYEQAVHQFVARLLENPDRNPFLHDFVRFAAIVVHFGKLNALAQAVLKATSPGVPDFYQGTELISLTLVDPDNRRPVDFARAQELLQDPTTPDLPSLLEGDGSAAKLHVISTLLQLRRTHERLFAEGRYEPMVVTGQHKDHVLAFSREHGGERVVVIVARWLARLTQADASRSLATAWDDAELQLGPPTSSPWMELFSGASVGANSGTIRVADVLRDLPVAVLVSVDA